MVGIELGRKICAINRATWRLNIQMLLFVLAKMLAR